MISRKRAEKRMIINGHSVPTQIDTGSDICVIQQSTHKKLKLPEYIKCELEFDGVGATNKTLGYFLTELIVDGEKYKDTF